jgi:hypothetical protein
MCDKRDGEPESCQDCGILICFDIEPGQGDDVMDRAYVTASGDLFCRRCGMEYDAREERGDEDW